MSLQQDHPTAREPTGRHIMSNDNGELKVDAGIGFLSKKEWFDLQAFALKCMHENPTTIDRMGTQLKLTRPANDPNWTPEKSPYWDVDFTKTVKEYEKLGYLFN